MAEHRIVYLPIFEQGPTHETQVANKRGLYDGLSLYGKVAELDYLAIPRPQLFDAVCQVIREIDATILFTQLHAADCLTPQQMRDIRVLFPNLIICNWSGDHWKHSLTSPSMLELCHTLDIQLTAAIDAIDTYRENNIRAFYWNMAYEKPVGNLPDMPTYDVVFIANVVSDRRRELMKFLKSLPHKVGIYGDWSESDGRNMYDFGPGEALYKKATISIADNTYPESCNFMSNRVYQTLVAGGALLLQQHIPRMAEIGGLVDGEHYIEWRENDDLAEKIVYWLDPAHEAKRRLLVEQGREFALAKHTYAERARQLFEEFIPEVARA